MSGSACITPPWWFEFAARRINTDKRGGWALMKAYRSLGLLRQSAAFRLPDGAEIFLPLDWPGAQGGDVFDLYEPDAIADFAAAITALPHPVTLIDCGADVGVFCRILLGVLAKGELSKGGLPENARKDGAVKRIVAIEPNARSFSLLRQNLDRADATLVFGAVSDRAGFGRLVSPPYSDGDHARYLEVSDAKTDLPVVTIDGLDIERGAAIALKIDVEGAELDVLRGAAAVLRAAPGFTVQIEAHPDVAQRTGVDPIEFLRFCNAIRPCRWRAYIEKTRQAFDVADLDAPFFEQVPADQVYDMVISSL